MSRTVTSYPDVNELLNSFAEGVTGAFPMGLIGIYLTGSLSYAAFNYNSSDIDVTVILRQPATPAELEALRDLHRKLVAAFPKWARRFECTYTPIGMLPSILPPGSRPWYWGGDDILYAAAPYGNEWIINNYLLYRDAVPLVGPDFRSLMPPVDIREVQKACVRDLFAEWESKRTDRKWFRDGHYESYFILNLCRILYTVMCKDAGSKQQAAAWAKGNLPAPCPNVVALAERWEQGMELLLQEKAVEFLDVVIGCVLATPLAAEMAVEIGRIRRHSGSCPQIG